MNDNPPLLRNQANAARARASLPLGRAKGAGAVALSIPNTVPANDPIASHVGRNTTVSEKNLVTG